MVMYAILDFDRNLLPFLISALDTFLCGFSVLNALNIFSV
jgi:hypothetical protein